MLFQNQDIIDYTLIIYIGNFQRYPDFLDVCEAERSNISYAFVSSISLFVLRLYRKS